MPPQNHSIQTNGMPSNHSLDASLNLSQRIKHIEKDNKELVIKIENAKRTISRLKLERQLLCEKLATVKKPSSHGSIEPGSSNNIEKKAAMDDGPPASDITESESEYDGKPIMTGSTPPTIALLSSLCASNHPFLQQPSLLSTGPSSSTATAPTVMMESPHPNSQIPPGASAPLSLVSSYPSLAPSQSQPQPQPQSQLQLQPSPYYPYPSPVAQPQSLSTMMSSPPQRPQIPQQIDFQTFYSDYFPIYYNQFPGIAKSDLDQMILHKWNETISSNL